MTATALGLAALLIVASTGVLWFRAARQVRLPSDRSRFVVAWLTGVGLGVAALVMGGGPLAGAPAWLAVLGGGLLCLTVAISRQRVSAAAIAVGQTIPDFSALDENGDVFQASSLMGHPTLLKFFRGHW